MSETRHLRAQTVTEMAEEREFLGQTYLVVPVIAMIEGVRFGGNQDSAELGLASDFGKYPVAWNNKPLVVNHPQINGVFVSANQVEVLETESFGFTDGAFIEDDKLKMNAWISLARAGEIEEVQAFVDQINDGVTIEVSVGFFSDVEQASGTFKAQSYSGIWRNIVPDHLAFLTDMPGACSVADGCGVPRINQAQEASMTLKTDSPKPSDPITQEEGGCTCGGACGGKVQTEAEAKPEATPAVQTTPTAEELEAIHANAQVITVNAIAEGIISDSITGNLASALTKYLKEQFGIDSYDYWVHSFTTGTTSSVIYQFWSTGSYVLKSLQFDMDAEGSVTFTGEPKNVRIVSRVHEMDNEENVMSDTPVVAKGADAPAGNETVVQAAPVILSRADALKAMSEADRTEVESALAVLQARKDTAVTALSAAESCKFEDTFLKAQSIEFLDNLVAMLPAEVAPVVEPVAQVEADDFSGRGAPIAPAVQANGGEVVQLGLAPLPADMFAKKG